MTTIRLHNTKTRKKEEFVPLDPSNVRMYVCGPTVYDRAHLGNARPVIVFDVLYRLLQHLAKENGWGKVTYVRNFTDVDDKINAAALARKEAGDPRSLEDLIHERTEETIGWYHADMDAVGALRPTMEPRATDWIGAMIAMTADLIAKGHAYAVEGHVLFRVRSYADYGKLSGRSVDDMIAGARVEVAPFKEDPMDFVLWKPSDAETPGWDSPWGRGRPGWHIECSAMAHELLGSSFDIHGGGIDLQFPHHENEIAQSACAHPEGSFARYWLHNEMLQVEGKKMSKSLGNFFTVRDLLDQGVPGEVIRFVMLGTHYGKPMDWTEKKRAEAEAELRKWKVLTYGVRPGDVYEPVLHALLYDLNTVQAITELRKLARQIASVDAVYAAAGTSPPLFQDSLPSPNTLRQQMVASAQLMGLLTPDLDRWNSEAAADVTSLEREMQSVREMGKEGRDFSVLDAAKTILTSTGNEVQMQKDKILIKADGRSDAIRFQIERLIRKWRELVRNRSTEEAQALKNALHELSIRKTVDERLYQEWKHPNPDSLDEAERGAYQLELDLLVVRFL